MAKYYQVSTLQALALGFSKSVITVDELKEWLTIQIEEDFGLNSMYDVRIDASFCRITSVEIKIPDTPAFDTYALKGASQDEIKSVEQGKGATK